MSCWCQVDSNLDSALSRSCPDIICWWEQTHHAPPNSINLHQTLVISNYRSQSCVDFYYSEWIKKFGQNTSFFKDTLLPCLTFSLSVSLWPAKSLSRMNKAPSNVPIKIKVISERWINMHQPYLWNLSLSSHRNLCHIDFCLLSMIQNVVTLPLKWLLRKEKCFFFKCLSLGIVFESIVYHT